MSTDNLEKPIEFESVSTWLEVMCKSRSLSWRAAALGAGLGPNTVQDIIKNPKKRPNRDTCRRLAQYFGAPADFVLRLAGHPPEQVNSAQARLDNLLEIIKGLAPGKQIELAQIANRFRGEKGEEFLLDGVIRYRRSQGGDIEMFGLRLLDKYFYVADLEDVPLLIPQKQIENPVAFLSRWALNTLYDAYVSNEDHQLRDQIEDWFNHRNRMEYFTDFGGPQQLRHNILIEIRSVTFGHDHKVLDFELDPAIQKYVDDDLKGHWIKDMNTPIYLPAINPDSILANELSRYPSYRSPMINAICSEMPIFGSELDPHDLRQIITERANTESVIVDLMYVHPSWPLPEDHVPPNAFAAMQERFVKDVTQMLLAKTKTAGLGATQPYSIVEKKTDSQPNDL